jgi:negative regulator of sigma E activity
MNEALEMQISAFVDGELPDNEAELLLRRLGQDAAMRQQVAKYLEIGRLMRQDKGVPGIDQLRVRIAAALGEEVIPQPEEEQAVGVRFMTPASGIAVAATVAAIALLGLSQLDGPVDAGVKDAVAIDLAPAYTVPTDEQVLLNSPSQQQMEYLRRHNESDIIYRMAGFTVSESLEVIEPDGHLQSGDDNPSEIGDDTLAVDEAAGQ